MSVNLKNTSQYVDLVHDRTSFLNVIKPKDALSTSDYFINLGLKITSIIFKIFPGKVDKVALIRLQTRLYWQLAAQHHPELQKAIKQMQDSVKIYQGKSANEPTKGKTEPKIIVENKDTLQAAKDIMQAKKVRVAAIDLANERKPCGSFNDPAIGSQEEIIAENSLLYPALDRALNTQLAALCKKARHIPKHRCVYIENVPIIRDPQSHKLLTDDKVDLVDIIAVAALDLRSRNLRKKYTDGKTFNLYGMELTKDKMRSVLVAAQDKKVRDLVLGAMGCGAFKNDSVEIAMLWHQVIQEEQFEGAFDEIHFAVYSAKPSDDKNFAAFEEEFKGI